MKKEKKIGIVIATSDCNTHCTQRNVFEWVRDRPSSCNVNMLRTRIFSHQFRVQMTKILCIDMCEKFNGIGKWNMAQVYASNLYSSTCGYIETVSAHIYWCTREANSDIAVSRKESK